MNRTLQILRTLGALGLTTSLVPIASGQQQQPLAQEFVGPGMPVVLERTFQGRPAYVASHNANSALAVGVTAIAPGGTGGYGLTGAGQRIGLWEVGGVPLDSHAEISSNLTIPTYALPQRSSASDHATHVAGTLVAAGVNAAAKGMAPGATVEPFNSKSDEFEMLLAAGTGLGVSNHSYGLITGWETITDSAGTPLYCKWYGDTSISALEDYRFGMYSDDSRDWDQICYSAEGYLPVTSAGNDGNDAPIAGLPTFVYRPPFGWITAGATPPADGAVDGGYDTLPSDGATAKNTLVVGAANQMTARYSSPTDVSLASFSSVGPTDDGRRPDQAGPRRPGCQRLLLHGERALLVLQRHVDGGARGDGIDRSPAGAPRERARSRHSHVVHRQGAAPAHDE